MPNASAPIALKTGSRVEYVFPTLSEVQLARIASHGRVRTVRAGEILADPGVPIRAFYGAEHLEDVQWKNVATGAIERHPFRHVFVMTGAVPNTRWLDGCVALDAKGFIKTGTDLTREDLAHWTLERAPYLLETNLPKVFAVGDVRCRSIKRVASAVGEGSMVVSFVHSVRQAEARP